MIWASLSLVLALFAVAYVVWTVRLTREIVMASRLVCQRCALSTVRMYINTEELVDATLLTAEHLKMISEDLRGG